MGPPPQCSGFIFGDWCVCNIFSLGCIRCSLVWSWAVPHRTAGAQHLVSEPRGAIPTRRRLGSNTQWRTTRTAVCTRWACTDGQMEVADGRSAACCGTQRVPMPIARGSRRQVEARTSGAASGSARSAKLAQIVVCRTFELRADLSIERAMVWGLTRRDVGAPWGGRVQRSWTVCRSRSALASSPEQSLARRRDC